MPSFLLGIDRGDGHASVVRRISGAKPLNTNGAPDHSVVPAVLANAFAHRRYRGRCSPRAMAKECHNENECTCNPISIESLEPLVCCCS